MITGYGVVTTHGSGMAAAWDALAAGTPAGRDYTPDGAGRSFFAAPIPEAYRPPSEIPRNLVHFLDPGSVIALDATFQALEMAGLGAGAGDSRRFALVDGLPYRAPGQPTMFVPHGQVVARTLGLRGPVIALAGAEASGHAAVIEAARLVTDGRADVALAGAAQALQEPLLEHLAGQDWLANGLAHPLDVEHTGMVPAEGAAFVVIEAEDHARERGARPIAAIAGSSLLFDPSAEPLATSDPAEAGRCIQAALAEAGYLQNQVDLVFSCADGRVTVDFSDAYGILRTFGRHANDAGLTAVAGALGSALAASGVLSLAVALEAIRRQEVVPIAGFATPERDVEAAYVTAARQERLDCLLVTSLGLGGTNASILLDAISGNR